MLSHRYLRGFIFAGLFFCLHAHAQTSATCSGAPSNGAGLLNQVHTIQDPTVGVALECSFDVSDPGNYQITLNDLGVVPGSSPAQAAPLNAVTLALTSGATVIGTPLTKVGSLQANLVKGSYVVRVAGAPGPLLGSGLVGIQVTNLTTNTVVANFSANLAPASTGVPGGVATLSDSFTVPTTGSYTVTLADLNLPQALANVTLVVTTSDGTFVTNPPLVAMGQTNVTLQQGVTYQIFGGATAGTAGAGLFSVTVTPAGGSGAPVYGKAVPVGSVLPVGSATVDAGGSYTFTLTDLAFPTALSSLTGLVVTNGQVVAQLAAGGTSAPFTSVAATYDIYVSATTSKIGSYAAAMTPQGGQPVLSVGRAVSTGNAGDPVPFSYDASVASAGSNTFSLADFSFPSALTGLSGAVVQNGAVVGTPLTAAGSATVSLAAGPVSVLVFATPGSGTPAGGLFGIELGSVYQTTQGVGTLFVQRQITVTDAAAYAVSVTDLSFPHSLSTFAVVVTQGTTQLGSIYGGGGFVFQGTAGNYFVNFIAQPFLAPSDGSDTAPQDNLKAGTYSLNVAAAPVVTLSASPTTVVSGGTVTLNWTATNSDTCTASGDGGFGGSQQTTGTATSGALTADTTFTLTCTGEGVSVPATAKVTVSAPASSGGGGHGGSITTDLLLCLGGVLLLKIVRHRYVIQPHYSPFPARQ